jgi:hypothetical protein
MVMDASLTMEKFNELLASDQEQPALIDALLKLVTLERPEDVLEASVVALAAWAWRW